MPENLGKSGQADDIRINIKQVHEVSYLSKELGFAPANLQQALKASA